MIDIHTHLLPGLDDGSSSLEESIWLGKALAEQGVTLVAATPHFNAAQQRPSQFLECRDQAERYLWSKWPQEFPPILVGAEVHYFDGMSHTEELPLLTLESTNILLLEMPFGPWSQRMVEEVLEIQTRRNLQVLLAHVERYQSFRQFGEQLRQAGVWTQCNASFFLHWKTKSRALKMLRKGEIQMLGSDCHNKSTRPPRLQEAREVIEKSLGTAIWREFNRQTFALFKARCGKL
jgi:protein-tyrosine phosphatase